MAKLERKAERVAWAMVGLAFMLFLVFFVLYLLSKAPVVGGIASGIAPRLNGTAYNY